jgi:hypothetical protein
MHTAKRNERPVRLHEVDAKVVLNDGVPDAVGATFGHTSAACGKHKRARSSGAAVFEESFPAA